MFCDNCNNVIKEKENFCGKCGKKIIRNEAIKEVKNQYYNGSDETYVREYMGKKADFFLNDRFSPGLLFTLFLTSYAYLVYRKMYFYGILWMLIQIGLNFIPEVNSYSFIFTAIFAVYFAFNFKELYINQAKEQVSIIKGENPTATKEEIMLKCRKKGGVNLLGALLLLIVVGVTTAMVIKDLL